MIASKPPLASVAGLFRLHHPTFSIAILQFGSTMVHTLFMFYYVKVFLNLYHITDGWFQAAQILYMIWNAINDPLFGYIQDIGQSWMRSRKKAILYAAPGFVLSFLLPWFRWNWDSAPPWVAGCHLIVSLFFYDGFFSFALLSFCALFAEASSTHSDRVRIMKYMQTASLLGLSVVMFVDKISSSLTHFHLFQICCVVVAGVGYLCCRYTALYAPSTESNSVATESKSAKVVSFSFREARQLTREVFVNRNFHCIVWCNFLHICRSTVHINFAAIFTEALLSNTLIVGTWQISVWYGVNSVLPQLLVIASSPIIEYYGPRKIMSASCLAAVVCGLLTYVFITPSQSTPFMAALLCESVLVHGFSPLFNIFFPEIISDDAERNNRPEPISSLIFSLNALFTKPAQSLAPMFVVYVLSFYGYSEYRTKFRDNGTVAPVPISDDLRSGMFMLICWLPVVLAGLEFMLLQFYTLQHVHQRDRHRTFV